MKKLLVVCGPTASGKSALAVECAKRLDGEIVSCDSLLVYRGLNIGTAKPSTEERGGIPHHLIDIAEPTATFSVSEFKTLALAAAEEISSRGKVPVLAGGTGFYLNAVLYPSTFGGAPASLSVREKYGKMAREEGAEAVHAKLSAVDPESAEKLHPNDVKRVIRALEIYETTGRKKSEQTPAPAPRFPYTAVAVNYPREELYARIDARVDAMMERGLVGEVRSLLSRGVPENAQCMQGIGYKEVVESLHNADLQSTVSDIIKKNTRNYAKRQLTFFKKLQGLVWLSPKPLTELCEEVIKLYEI